MHGTYPIMHRLERLAYAGTHEMLEGLRPSRVVEFPSKQAIKDWYNDPGYRPLIAKRRAA